MLRKETADIHDFSAEDTHHQREETVPKVGCLVKRRKGVVSFFILVLEIVNKTVEHQRRKSEDKADNFSNEFVFFISHVEDHYSNG